MTTSYANNLHELDNAFYVHAMRHANRLTRAALVRVAAFGSGDREALAMQRLATGWRQLATRNLKRA